jgi:hypothetical protein
MDSVHVYPPVFSRQLVQQSPGIFQIGSLKTFAEPVIDRCQQRACFLLPALIAPQPGQTGRAAQLPASGLLVAGNSKRLLKTGFRFTGSIRAGKTVAGSYRAAFPEEYQQFRAVMPQGILNDIKAINDNLDKYPDIFPDGRDFFYNNYLKSQGISEGLQNYSRVILLEVAYKKAHEQ